MSAGDAAPSQFELELGANLRALRNRLGMSLSEVEAKSGGRWKAVVVGSYERADRAITVDRLAGLCDFYNTPIVSLLPGVPLVTETFAAITAAKDAHISRLAAFYEGELARVRAELKAEVA